MNQLLVRGLQLSIRFLDLLRAQESLRFHLFRSHLEFLGELARFRTLALQTNELGHILHTMDDVLNPSVRSQDR